MHDADRYSHLAPTCSSRIANASAPRRLPRGGHPDCHEDALQRLLRRRQHGAGYQKEGSSPTPGRRTESTGKAPCAASIELDIQSSPCRVGVVPRWCRCSSGFMITLAFDSGPKRSLSLFGRHGRSLQHETRAFIGSSRSKRCRLPGHRPDRRAPTGRRERQRYHIRAFAPSTM